MNTPGFHHCLIIILFLLLPSVLISQINQKLYFDERWNISRAEDAQYFRYIRLDTAELKMGGLFKDFTTDSILISSGLYIDRKKEGLFTYYWENGNIKASGNYQNDIIDGEWVYYYPSGEVKYIIEFTKEDFVFNVYYDSLGNDLLKNESTKWEMTFRNDFDTSPFTITGTLVKGNKNGEWAIFHQGEAIGFDLYKNGKFKKSRYFDPSISVRGKLIQNQLFTPFYLYRAEMYQFNSNVSTADYPYFVWLNTYEEVGPATGIINGTTVSNLDIGPKYNGGMRNILQILASSLRYPALARVNYVSGTVYVEIVIDEKGNVTSLKVIKSAHEFLDKEALRVTSLLIDWEPAIYEDQPVSSKIILPVRFNIERKYVR